MLPFDQQTRFDATFSLLRAAGVPRGASVLDVGGFPGTFAKYLRAAGHEGTIVTTDLAEAEMDGYVRCLPEAPLPFANASFDVVLSNDTLEHVPPDLRARFLGELQRVAARTIVVAAPAANHVTTQLETMLLAFHERRFGRPHPWFIEHRQYELPDPAWTAAQFSAPWRVARTAANAPILPWALWHALHIAKNADSAFDDSFADWETLVASQLSGHAAATQQGTGLRYRALLLLDRESEAVPVPSSNEAGGTMEDALSPGILKLAIDAFERAIDSRAGSSEQVLHAIDRRVLEALALAESQLADRGAHNTVGGRLRRFLRP